MPPSLRTRRSNVNIGFGKRADCAALAEDAALSNNMACREGLYASAMRTASSADNGFCKSASTSVCASRRASSVSSQRTSAPSRSRVKSCALPKFSRT